MNKTKIAETIREGFVLVSDGAWGTFLQKKGIKPGECPELWCIEHPDIIFEIADNYIKAGADMVETNSFGANSFKLAHYGLAEKACQINEAAASISRKAAVPDKWVIASMGPTGKILIMGDVTEEELYEAYKEQAVSLEKGGADAVCIETMSAIDEAVIAIKAVKENTKLEIITTFTFEKTIQNEYKTMMGVSPAEAAIAANCGNGVDGMIDIVKEIKNVLPEIPILVHANAGLPQHINGVDVFPESPEDMAKSVPLLVKAGANIIGGCCGTTPEHIKSIREALILAGIKTK